jgi:hypothetical protein
MRSTLLLVGATFCVLFITIQVLQSIISVSTTKEFAGRLGMRLLLIVSIILMAAPAVADCPLEVEAGQWVRIYAYYWHEAEGGGYYTFTRNMPVTEDGTVNVIAEGHPAAYNWKINGRDVKQCGDIPVFHDKFETSDLSRWSEVVQ